jgi:hypothetical protein
VAWFIATELKLPQYEQGISRAAIDGRTLLQLAEEKDELHLGSCSRCLLGPYSLRMVPAVLKIDVGITIVPHRRTIIAASQVARDGQRP